MRPPLPAERWSALQAARAYDKGAIRLRGWEEAVHDGLNFPAEDYEDAFLVISEMVPLQFIESLRLEGLMKMSPALRAELTPK